MNHSNKICRLDKLVIDLKQQCETQINHDLTPLIEKLHAIYQDSISLIVLYGSCLRTNNFTDGILDFYLIVNNYNAAYKSTFYAVFNKLLPPNVFYVESGDGNNVLRAKYAVISEKDFNSGINDWFHPYLWSRFAQPVRLIYYRDEKTREQFYDNLNNSVIRYLSETVPALQQQRISAEQIWTNALSLSYAAELRPEPEGRSHEIVNQSIEDLTRLTISALPAIPCLQAINNAPGFEKNCGKETEKRNRISWQIRRWQGKGLSILRLIKAAFTFHDGVEYAAWKIYRHTGIEIEITPALKKYPVLLGFKILWQLIRRKAIR